MSATTRRLGLVLVAAGVLLLATATYGFGSLVADRTLGVATSDDDEAYLQYDAADTLVVDGTGSDPVAFTLNNTFDEPLAANVTLSGPESGAVAVAGPENLPVDDAAAFSLSCSSTTTNTTTDLTVTVEAYGESTDVTMDRELTDVEIRCDG
jgi:hypothetical protein